MGRFRSVAFIGVDGSGKSTQARLLHEALEASGVSVVHIHSFGRKLLGFLPDRSQPVSRSSTAAGGQAGLRKRLIAAVELLDIGLYAWYQLLRSRIGALRSGQEVWLVSDRSLYDVLAKHHRAGYWPAGILRVLVRLAPPSGLTIWLETPPREALARDREFPLSYYEERHAAYRELCEWVHCQAIPTSSATPDEIALRVRRHLGLGVPAQTTKHGSLPAKGRTGPNTDISSHSDGSRRRA